LEEELHQTKEERDHLQQLSNERQKTIEKLNYELDEAHAVITKLEEARIVLNRLLGPNGVITEREREKYLKNVAGGQARGSAGFESSGA
jgi:septal ring factor EnvC (AmiA/AmiB activator)